MRILRYIIIKYISHFYCSYTNVRKGHPRACTDARTCLIFFFKKRLCIQSGGCSWRMLIGAKRLLALSVCAIIPSHCTISLLFLMPQWLFSPYLLPQSKQAMQLQLTVTGKSLCETDTCQTAQICLSLCCSWLVACSVKQTPVTNAILTSIFICHGRTCRFVK
jgi:hypothetical protein